MLSPVFKNLCICLVTEKSEILEYLFVYLKLKNKLITGKNTDLLNSLKYR